MIIRYLYFYIFISVGFCLDYEPLYVNNPDLEELIAAIRYNISNNQETTFDLDEILKAVADSQLPANASNANTTILLDQDLQKKLFYFPEPTVSVWNINNFYLFTKNYRDGKEFELIDPRNVSSIKACHFEQRKTYVIVHGFSSKGLAPWVLDMKDKLLNREDCNVISVDWPAGNRFYPSYITAAGRVESVGNATAQLYNKLTKYKGLALASLHCIGHSLGAHVCGFSGKSLEDRVGRISGLDPAGPFFHNLAKSKRLDKMDAKYVDVSHTNACDKWVFWTDCYGIDEDLGHSDFYPNNGKHQPACVGRDSSLLGEIGCDHEMAYKYYLESLDYGYSGTHFLARECNSFWEYMIGTCGCGKFAQFMGFYANSLLSGHYMLETYPTAPFAMTDPLCSDQRGWNMFVYFGYIVISLIFFGVLLTMLVFAMQSCCDWNQFKIKVRRKYFSRSRNNETTPLVRDSLPTELPE